MSSSLARGPRKACASLAAAAHPNDHVHAVDHLSFRHIRQPIDIDLPGIDVGKRAGINVVEVMMRTCSAERCCGFASRIRAISMRWGVGVIFREASTRTARSRSAATLELSGRSGRDWLCCDIVCRSPAATGRSLSLIAQYTT